MYWDYILSIAGVAGFILAGKKIWWAWYVNIAAQFIWFAYAFVTHQYGFFIGSAIYFLVFSKNAYDWTKEHREQVRLSNAIAVEQVNGIKKHLAKIQEGIITPEEAEKRIREMTGFEHRHDNT